MIPRVAEKTAWLVNDHTNAKTTAWVSATTVRDARGGRYTRVPGVNTKNSTAA